MDMYLLGSAFGASLSAFVFLKILTQDFRLHIKETIYFILVSAALAVFFEFEHIFLSDRGLITFLILWVGTGLTFFSQYFYLHKMKFYPFKKAFIFFGFVFFASDVVGSSVSLIFVQITGQVSPGLGWLPLEIVSLLVANILLAVLVVKFTKRLRKTINNSLRLQMILCVLFIAIITLLQAMVSSIYITGEDALRTFTIHIGWLVVLFVSVFGAILLAFSFYTKTLKAKHTIELKEAELAVQSYYTAELEHHQTAIRKFQHDQNNILTSIHAFLHEEDLAGLKDYFAKVETMMQSSIDEVVALEALSKIKVREIKGILAAKLIRAQQLDVPATFEADEEIDYIPADSIVLVRMLGIVLDNAIEALVELGHGELRVACLKDGTDTLFVVQNTYPADRPEPTPGVSTKGEGRGMGLLNLSELANAQPNILLETSIKDEKFTQVIRITEGGA